MYTKYTYNKSAPICFPFALLPLPIYNVFDIFHKFVLTNVKYGT